MGPSVDETLQQPSPDSKPIAESFRIYAPIAYPLVRTAQFVPVVHLEVMPLAIWFPVIWRQQEGGYELVAVRSLLPNGGGQPPGSPRNPASLPLVFRAYPFCIKGVSEEEGTIVAVDSAIADEPTDAGATILTSARKLGRGAEQRCRALALFSRSLPQTREITDFLVENRLLEPWPLRFNLGEEVREIDDLFVVRPAAFDGGDLHGFTLRFGAFGAHCLAGHRLSLFRARGLVISAQRAHRLAHASTAS